MNSLKKPSFTPQNKVRSKHDYVVPMNNFSSLPTPASRTRMIRNIHYKRISFPPSIKEEDEDEQQEEQDEEDIPLAILAYKKGLVVPDNMFPLVQHIQPIQTQRKRHYYHYPTIQHEPPSEPPKFYHTRNYSSSSLSSASSSDSLPTTPVDYHRRSKPIL